MVWLLWPHGSLKALSQRLEGGRSDPVVSLIMLPLDCIIQRPALGMTTLSQTEPGDALDGAVGVAGQGGAVDGQLMSRCWWVQFLLS
jgi:hypothetical protein